MIIHGRRVMWPRNRWSSVLHCLWSALFAIYHGPKRSIFIEISQNIKFCEWQRETDNVTIFINDVTYSQQTQQADVQWDEHNLWVRGLMFQGERISWNLCLRKKIDNPQAWLVHCSWRWWHLLFERQEATNHLKFQHNYAKSRSGHIATGAENWDIFEI